MPDWRPPRATEIDRKMREDFARRLKEGYGISSESTDPLLAVLFRTFAGQIEDIYKEAGDVIPAALLDELIAGVGVPERRSQPAQLVVKFTLPEGRELYEAGTELIGETSSGERLVFALDSDIEVSNARIVFAASYQDGMLRLLPGVELPEEFEKARPSLEAVSAPLGPIPAVFLAVDLPEDSHLDHHGIYFELAPDARQLARSLRREFWCLLDEAGAIRAEGLLRPHAGRCGVRQLRWLSDPAPAGYDLPEGFYGARTFVFPSIPADRRFLSRIPQKMLEPIHRIFGKSGDSLFEKHRAWIVIGLPGCTNLNEELVRVALHCVTASNLEVLNQTLYFRLTGTSVPVSREGGAVKQLVMPVSVIGERGMEYLAESRPSADADIGRFRFRRGRIEITPARTPAGVTDQFATVRLLVSDGLRANTVGAGSITTFLSRGASAKLTLSNLTAAAGGTDGEPYPDARRRFSELLLSRERIVSYADLETVVKSFEPKVSQVRVRPALERTAQGLQRIQQVTVTVAKDSLLDVDEQSRVLQRELQNHLSERMLLDLDVRVAVDWN